MILGHERQIAYLDKVFQRGAVSHAYIFAGPAHVGKGAVAKEWMKKFFCLSAEDGVKADEKVCGACSACKQIDANIFPDVSYVSLGNQLTDNPKTEIGIETAREIKRRASVTSYNGGYKFFLIDDAESLNVEAQNTLLKILEEPSERTVFIFLVGHVSNLLPTIVSRSAVIPFFLVPDAAMRKFLESQKISKQKQEEFLALSQGTPGRLMLLLRDKDALAEASEWLKKAEHILESGLLESFRASDELASDDKMQEQFFAYFFHALHKKFLAAPKEQKSLWLEKNKKALELFALHRQTNVNSKIIFDHMFLALR
ncbi:hypothetical protein KGQ34_01040 [Patescibacteria group bacterium]|nr:hypothetical protein [Patescibacteria group bacterium]